MDFSSANTALWGFILQFGIIAGVILVSHGLRQRFSIVRKSLIPTAVMAGFIILILKLFEIINLNGEFLEILVYHGIALGFIAMSLRVSPKDKRSSGNLTGAKTGALIVGTYLIQGIVGLIITISLAYTCMPSLFKAAGLLLPMGYGQGPGQANNVGTIYEGMGFSGGRSFGLAIAAAGYLCACIVGVLILNILAKKGRITASSRNEKAEALTIDDFQDNNEIPISDSIDKFSIQIAMVLVIYLATYTITHGFSSFCSSISEGLANTINPLLWGFNFIIGSVLATLVKVILENARSKNIIKRQYQNNYLLNRISGFFFDIMIIAGVASINPENLTGLWLPFTLMAIGGAIITWIYLAWVCKYVYKGYYYEGLLSMYGMMTGTIGSGILLLREIDPEYKTPAANNLIVGSSFAIVFGIPILAFIGIAPKSDFLCIATLGIIIAYLALLLIFICKVRPNEVSKDDNTKSI